MAYNGSLYIDEEGNIQGEDILSFEYQSPLSGWVLQRLGIEYCMNDMTIYLYQEAEESKEGEDKSEGDGRNYSKDYSLN